jgi:hypothetical protein
MARTFKERALQAILAGGRYERMWSKTIPASGATVGHMNHLFQYAGDPVAGVYTGVAKTGTPVTGGSSPTLTTGIITVPDPQANESALLTFFDALSAVSGQTGTFIIGDLLAYYPGFVATVGVYPLTQTTTDVLGTNILPRYTDGEGVMIFADITTALGAVASNLSVIYTDQDGTTGTTDVRTVLASGVQGKLGYVYTGNGPFMRLATGDRGVKSIQSCLLSADTGAGAFALCLFKPLLTIPVIQNTGPTHNYGLWEGISNLDAVLLSGAPALSMIWVPAATTVGTLTGMVKKLDIRSV